MTTLILILWITSVADGIHFRLGVTSHAVKAPYAGAAVSMAIDRAHNEGLLKGHTFSIPYRLGSCKDPAIGMDHAIELVEEEKVDAVFGLICSEVCIATGYYYTHFDVPTFPTACTSPDLDDRQLFPTLVRCAPTYNQMGNAFGVMVTQYGWKRVALFTQEDSPCVYGAEAIKSRMKLLNVTVAETLTFTKKIRDDEMEFKLDRLRGRTRSEY
ncbi:hypothetical protein LSH36_433g00014 [Paralvinella palmiformis]|uniref:Receptor ligand binding region domain-containing protein n=1 Tax=Paralvinella palmiformis TaxID=53620 RepID=A0AAD9JBN8_9ANNE|nr:hypothetical protein LSH36_433g00014 [Paralvinella palmiformis]